LPTQYNVAVALEDAQINMNQSSPDYLLQNLTNVYTDPDPRTYPLSSYVYMIEPTGTYPSPEPDITTPKRQSIADFEYYAICQGQKEIGPIGYSPLPVNLVEASFAQIQLLQQADPNIILTNENIDNCDEPTFVEGQPNTNYLATIAPQPPACDKSGAGPCAAGVTPNGIGATPNVSGSYPGSSGSSTGTGAGSAGSAGRAGPGASGPGTTSSAPATPSGQNGGATSAAQALASASSAAKNAPPPLETTELPFLGAVSWIAAGAVALLLALFAVPILIGRRRSRLRARVEQ
jgi:hypothetical protein